VPTRSICRCRRRIRWSCCTRSRRRPSTTDPSCGARPDRTDRPGAYQRANLRPAAGAVAALLSCLGPCDRSRPCRPLLSRRLSGVGGLLPDPTTVQCAALQLRLIPLSAAARDRRQLLGAGSVPRCGARSPTRRGAVTRGAAMNPTRARSRTLKPRRARSSAFLRSKVSTASE